MKSIRDEDARGADRAILTAKAIAAMKPGEWAADPAARGAGRLQVRKLSSGEASFYYRYVGPDGVRERLALGTGLTLVDARKLAAKLSRRYQEGERDLRAILAAEEREARRQRDVALQVDEAETMRRKATLGLLATSYVKQLERDGKVSAPKVARAFKIHVEKPWPKLWATPAADITLEDLFQVVARLTAAGKQREAGKVRAYLKAAYSAAIRARADASALQELRELRLSANPARDLLASESESTPGERALSEGELRAYWRRVVALEGAPGALLRFHLLTGGQRIDQLARLTKVDLDEDLQAICIRDFKGRRRKARQHVVPLIPAAATALKEMGGGELGPYLFTVTGGQTGAGGSTIRKYVKRIADAMAEAGELSGGQFSVKDLRRTVETRLAAAKVGKEVRAQLQSHGLSGVQDRHYDRHDYLDEKRAALQTLYRLMTRQATAKVVDIGRK